MKFDVQDLSCGYRDAVVLEDISFSLIDGDVLCILGPNGVGKTTLFKTILGLLPRLGGKILCDDQVIDDGHECTNKSWIAYVPQAHRPAFAFTVFDIVLMGRTSHLKAFATPSDKDRAITRDVLSELGLMDLAERPYTQISGGERQLVLIARALVQQPQILVMDEPAASLDFGNQATMLQHVRNLAYKKGLVVLMTSHNPDHAILVANKTLLIEGRAKTLFGDTNQVVSDSTLSSLYHTPIRILEGMSCQDQKQRSCCLCL
ncbi:MAG: ABC transporter ATP-binding protein [Eggerthellaceae bacterium]|nr:ABC transporter ATP-binding protein [Eggerthellaceae bacterium]MCH4220426.1 ABC transporter ATP-binding protein [Eggerthellaceae bacterium]